MAAIKSTGKFALLTILFLVCYLGGAIFFVPNLGGMGTPEPSALTPPLDILVIGCANVLIIWAVIRASQWCGWWLMLATSFAYYGITTVMTQIETAYFLTGITLFNPELLKGLFLMGLPVAIVFIPLAVIILGKGRRAQNIPQPNPRLVISARQWGWKMCLISLAYLLLYFSAGYFIAWQNPELRAFYGGTDPGSFLLQMQFILKHDPWLIPFQILRSGMWVLFALPIIRMIKGKPWKTALILGLLYAIPVNIGHLMANPLIPSNSVRLTHMVETASSTFIFGLIVVWLLHRAHTSLPDLFGLRSANKSTTQTESSRRAA
jgi:hypothetical protein